MARNSVFPISESQGLSPRPAGGRRQTHLGQSEDLGVSPFHLPTVVSGMSNQLPVVGVGFSYRRAVRKTMKTRTYTQRADNNKSLLQPANKKPFLNPDKAVALTCCPKAVGKPTISWKGSCWLSHRQGLFHSLNSAHSAPHPPSSQSSLLKKIRLFMVYLSLKIHALPTTTDELIGNKGHFLTKLLFQQRTAMTSK